MNALKKKLSMVLKNSIVILDLVSKLYNYIILETLLKFESQIRCTKFQIFIFLKKNEKRFHFLLQVP